jgi:glycosyltransferase 2 family protein
MARIIVVALTLSITGALLVWLFFRIDFDIVRKLLERIPFSSLVFSGLAACLIPLFASCRWLGIIGAHPETRVSFVLALRMVLFAIALYPVLPAKGGDFVKLLYLRKQVGPYLVASLVVFERLLDIFVISVLCVFGSWWSRWYAGMKIGGALIVAIGSVFLLITLIPVKNSGPNWLKAEEGRLALRRWFGSTRLICLSLVGSTLTWTSSMTIVSFLLCAEGKGVYLPHALAVWPVAILVGLVPITIGGIGTRDATFAGLMAGYLSIEEAAIVSIGYTCFVYLFLPLICLPVAVWETKNGLCGSEDSKSRKF